jgi:hypothetical protein
MRRPFFCPENGQQRGTNRHADRWRCAGLAQQGDDDMSTVHKLVARNAVWLSAALLLLVAACGEQGGGDQTEETPPATTQQQ